MRRNGIKFEGAPVLDHRCDTNAREKLLKKLVDFVHEAEAHHILDINSALLELKHKNMAYVDSMRGNPLIDKVFDAIEAKAMRLGFRSSNQLLQKAQP